MSTMTRRSLVAAAPAAIVAAAAPALANQAADAELLALRAPYERTLAIMEAVSPAHDRAGSAYFALRSERPDLDHDALRQASGLIPAEYAWMKAVDDNLDVILEIADEPATTLAGLIFKAQVSKRADNSEPDLLASIVDDLIAMEGRVDA